MSDDCKSLVTIIFSGTSTSFTSIDGVEELAKRLRDAMTRCKEYSLMYELDCPERQILINPDNVDMITIEEIKEND